MIIVVGDCTSFVGVPSAALYTLLQVQFASLHFLLSGYDNSNTIFVVWKQIGTYRSLQLGRHGDSLGVGLVLQQQQVVVRNNNNKQLPMMTKAFVVKSLSLNVLILDE